VENDDIQRHIGHLDGEMEVKRKVMAMNGIQRRYYAQDQQQQPTHDVYELGASAVGQCLQNENNTSDISFLAAGTTYAPLAAPGIASILHHRLQKHGLLNHPLEISSHAGICSSAATAMIAAIRGITSGQHQAALCVGAEMASAVTNAANIRPVDDRDQHTNVRNSQWFMSVFLRFMLSDGAGAVLLQNHPHPSQMSFRINWTEAMSFANETPLCMKLDNRTALLSQDLAVLSRHLYPTADKFLSYAFKASNDTLDSYDVVLPHISSFFFRRKFERMIAAHCVAPEQTVPFWTDLETSGNTGAASIYIMLDHYVQQQEIRDGQRILLFVPESGQFNFVLVSLTAVAP
jgi:3-oxoacyl-[acyl-carrier-protein] synthase-3